MFIDAMCDFVRRIGGEPSVGASGEQGAAVLGVALGALRSAEHGAVIDLQNESDQVKQWLASL